MIDPCPDTDPSALSPYGGSDGGDHNHDYSGSSAAKGRARGVPSSDREGGRERGAISVLNCILDFSLSAIKSVERRGRRGKARVDVQLCYTAGGGGIGKRKQCLARSATLFTAQTLSSSFEGMRGECGAHSMSSEPDPGTDME